MGLAGGMEKCSFLFQNPRVPSTFTNRSYTNSLHNLKSQGKNNEDLGRMPQEVFTNNQRIVKVEHDAREWRLVDLYRGLLLLRANRHQNCDDPRLYN